MKKFIVAFIVLTAILLQVVDTDVSNNNQSLNVAANVQLAAIER